MKNYYFMLIFPFFGYSITAQVGINTTDPQATLHVERRTDQTKADGIIPPRFTGDELRAKSAAYGAAQNGAIVYVTESVTATTDPKTSAVLTKGLFVYDAFASNGTGTGLWNVIQEGPATPSTVTGDGVYAAKFTSDFSLLGLTLISSGQRNFTFTPNNSTVPSVGNTTVQVSSSQMAAGIYTVPSTGIYQINYSYKEGTGLNLAVLTSSGINIRKAPLGSNTYTILDSKGFSGANLVVLSLSLTQSQISHLYSLTAGDKLQFGISRTGIATLDLLNTVEVDLSIYRIK
ncbi:hypothetical protein NZ698_18350 [Chryseobacterium sp. PBS4-4]|uniref:C1q domain-containing protein n=1 Tax=Chryseobacterium edaphi TaxID=2976532 RepID=A0ABT2WEX1_9FLAO|nr:hypothetical protein [Chryseobacterium edaphi]MCU7619145.1 hypothetical protein [Chryseobacterium edaphi]